MNKRESVSPPRFVRETAIVYHHEDTVVPSAPPASLFPRFPGSSPGPSGEAAPPSAPSFDHPSDATSTASDQAPSPGRVWWYVLYEELARRDAVIDALAERVECLERESCRRQVSPFERRRYYE